MSRVPALPLVACLALPLLLTSSPAAAGEGQWKPEQLAHVEAMAKKAGLELTPAQLWDPAGDERSGGLLRASINLNGCSAAFISEQGLIATNHHCAYGALQANSSVEHDYLEDGFLAADHGEELRAEGRTVKLLRGIRDVTEEVRPVLAAAKDDLARAKAYDRVRNELVDACEDAGEFHSCRVASFFNNTRFELHEYIELRDLRLVYAPPAAIGEYGGETDNWMWPRHTGDFALLRAYAGPDNQPADYAEANQPYAPGQWLRPSPEGVDPGDYVGILGYPGKTERYLWSAEVARHHEQWLSMRVMIYGEWIEILERAKERDAAVEIKVAAFKKSLANRHKNAAGKIAGLDRLNFSAGRVDEDSRLRGGSEAAAATVDALEAITTARRERAGRQFLLDNLRYAPRSLAIARTLATWAQQRAVTDDLERKAGYRDRDRERIVHRLEGWAKDYDAQVDVEMLASFLAYADGLDAERIRGFDEIMGPAKGSGGMGPKRDGVSGPPPPYLDAAKAALEGTALTDASTFEALLDTPARIEASADPMLALARDLIVELDALAEIKDRERGRLLELTPVYFELLSKLRTKPAYSDANGTLRVSHSTIQGYLKWNEEEQEPQTTLAGAVAKHRGGGDFDLPEAVLAAAESSGASRWADQDIGDVPIAFLTDGDTTGGNSGSPVIDAKGRLIGFNFDRVWENVAGDYVWRRSQSRNISVDIRYLYWMLEAVAGADHLLAELGVADYVVPAATTTSAAKGDDAPGPKTPELAPRSGCGCATQDSPGGGLLGFALLGLAALGLRRRPAGSERA